MRLVLDWDGTVTETDSLWTVLDEFGDPAVFASVEGSLVEGRLSFREVMELEFATVTAPVAEVAAFLRREVRIRAGFAELATAERPLLLSSGFHELIEPVLAREGVEVEVRANRIEARPDGWRVLWRDPEPCRSAATSVSAAACRPRRSPTQGTATPTAAPLLSPTASSLEPGSRTGSRAKASPSSLSTISPT